MGKLSEPIPVLPPPKPAPQAGPTNRLQGTSQLATPPSSPVPHPLPVRTSTAAPPAHLDSPIQFPHAIENVFELQVALARCGISPGPMDGRWGSQTRAALRAFQVAAGLPTAGTWDVASRQALVLSNAPLMDYEVTPDDFAGLEPVPSTWWGKSLQHQLGYETILELVAERGHAYPELIRRLNPGRQWEAVKAGDRILIPAIKYPQRGELAAMVHIHLGARTLQTFGSASNLLAHFPCSIGQRLDKRPIGILKVVTVIQNPNYVFDPDVFPESEEGRQLGRRLVLPPGPNNPVGTIWIGLDKPGYGIHGTPRPTEVGRTESHGCFRLANWNAEYLAQLVTTGTPVVVRP